MDNLRFVARTGSQLQMFVDFIGTMRCWGRGLRRAVAGWYLDKHVKDAAYQAVKHRQRYNWTHRDLLRKAHPKARAIDKDMNVLLAWITHGTLPSWDDHSNLRLIYGYESAQTQSVTALAKLIEEYDLTWEMVPTAMLKEKEVWKALSKRMPLTALLRNLSTLTRVGVIAPRCSPSGCARGSSMASGEAMDRLDNPERLWWRARRCWRESARYSPHRHPVGPPDLPRRQGSPGQAHVYAGAPGDGRPGPRVRPFIQPRPADEPAALPGHRRVRLDGRWRGRRRPRIEPQDGSGRHGDGHCPEREPNYYMAGFTSSIQDLWDRMRDRGSYVMSPLNITASDSISDAIQKTQSLPFGRTDCALPMLHAMEMKMNVDCFIILTDSETWAGNIHPVEALRQYRVKSGIPAKLIVVGIVSNGFSIADPDDAGMLDVVGFDAAAPALIADFTSPEQG